ncbi:MAG: polysaccharide deacetylase family protein [Bacteroidetes bacterium]|nr:polysaccharide deacetylase family protein [Bacteroidota bacterium]
MNKLRLIVCVFCAIGIASILFGAQPFVVVFSFLIALLLIIYGSAYIGSNMFLEVYTSGEKAIRQISLTFDDGPDPILTSEILQVLESYKASATFFMIGRHMEAHPGLVQKVYNSGHLIGNHTYTHSNLIDLRSKKTWVQECKQTDEIFRNLTGRSMNLFRPPYGVTNPAIAAMNKIFEYDVIGWSLRSMDTVIEDDTKLTKRLKRKLKNGDIILFHDTRQNLALVLKMFLEYCLQENIRIVPITELLDINAYKD